MSTRKAREFNFNQNKILETTKVYRELFIELNITIPGIERKIDSNSKRRVKTTIIMNQITIRTKNCIFLSQRMWHI
jgi:hypothetical protein